MKKSVKIKSPYILATGTRFVQPGKIEIDANERAVIEEFKAAFSFAPSSILSLTICEESIMNLGQRIIVLGCPGGGKSAFSKRLHDVSGLS